MTNQNFHQLVEINNHILLQNQMSEQEQLITLIRNILQPQNNQLRAESQKLLSTMTDSKLTELAIVLINILKSDQSDEIKQFVLTHLRKHLSAFSEEKYKNTWGKISPENKQYIQTSLFESLHQQKSSGVRNICADAIGQIGGSIMSISEKNWPKFLDCVFLLLNDSNPNSIVSGLLIFQNFFGYCSDIFNNQSDHLCNIFKKSFEHQNNKVKSAGIKAFSGYILSADKKTMSKLEPLIVPLYQVAFHLLLNDNGNTDGLQVISDIIQMQPKILKKTFNQLNDLMQNVIKIKNLEASIKRMATESLISFAQRYPALFRQNKQKLTGLIQLLFYHMIEIDEEITDQWKIPPEGYSQNIEEGDDFETTTFGMTSVDRLIASVGEKQMLPYLSITVQKMLTMSDWRYKYASIMALSQTGQYIEDATTIKWVVQMLLGFLADSNPMLRFASCHAIGQISDDMKPHYQQHYGKDSFLKLAALLKDPIPRVVSHSASALTNLIGGMNYTDISQYLPQLISALLELSTNGISLVKESVLTTIASIAQISKEHYLPFFQKTSQILFSIVQKHPGKEYKQLKGLVIQALTTIAQAIGKQSFKPIAPTLIEYMITVQQSQLQQVDPQKQYVLAGWQRLCVVLGKDIAPYLSRILPSLFNIVQGIVDSSIKGSDLGNLIDPVEGNDEFKINTFQTEQADVAIAMLNVFIKQVSEQYLPYAQRTTKIMLSIVQSMINQTVKEEALESLPLLVKLIKTNNLEMGITYSKNFLKILTEAALEEYDTQILISKLSAMKEILQLYDNRFLTVQQLKGFSDQILKVLLKSDERKDDTKGLTTEDLQDDEKDLLNQQITMQEQVQVAVSELIGQMFKTHKQMNVNLIEYITKNLLPKVFVEGLSDNMYKFGIFLIDDMVEYLGYNILSTLWLEFYNVFHKFCLHKSVTVRQASCYGLGIYAQNTPAQIYKPFIQKSLQILIQAADIPKGNQSEKMHGHCKDNAISAFGKIIKYHGGSFDPRPCLLMWLNYLPLKNDKMEAQLQHLFLTQVINNNIGLLIEGENQESANVVLKILQIFGDIIQTKFTTNEITSQIKQSINRIKSLPLFISNYDMFWSKLNQMQTVKLTMLMKQAS